MPIGEAHKTGNSFTGIMEYILAEGKYKNEKISKKPEIIFQNFSFEKDYKLLGKEFRLQADENKNVKKPVFHFTLNFSEKDNINRSIQIDFLKKLMNEMGVKDDNHQFIVVRHNDKHPHYHVLVNRVGLDGTTLSDKNSKLRIGTAVDKIEKELGLDNYLEKTRKFIYDSNTEKGYRINDKLVRGNKIKSNKDKQIGVRDKKDFIQLKVLRAIKDPNITSLSLLKDELLKDKIEFKYNLDAKNRLGVSFKYEGIAVKGTQIKVKGSVIKNQLVLNSKNSNINVKKEDYQNLLKNLSEAFREFDQHYKNGKIPSFKEVLTNNNLTLTEDGNLKFNSVQIKTNELQTLKKKWDTEFYKAAKEYKESLESYNSLMKTEPKKGVLGLLLPHQIKFNEDLAKQKSNAYKPSFRFEINIKSQGDLMVLMRSTRIDKIDMFKITQKESFELDDDVKRNLQNRYDEQLIYSKENIIDKLINTSGSEEDVDNQRKRKRNFRR